MLKIDCLKKGSTKRSSLFILLSESYEMILYFYAEMVTVNVIDKKRNLSLFLGKEHLSAWLD